MKTCRPFSIHFFMPRIISNPRREINHVYCRLYRSLALSKGKFANVELLKNEAATIAGIHNAFERWAAVVKSGDVFAFYIATHGGYNGVRAGLSAYNGLYPVSTLVSDSSLFTSGSLFLGIVMSCHSRAMVDYSESDPEKFQYQMRSGLAQCRVNAAWISSCGYDENSYNSPTSSQSAFGEWFLEKGWQSGFADAVLHGVDYSGGNGDGKLTLLELAKYAHAFSKGVSDARPSEVYWDSGHGNLLGQFVIDSNCSPPVIGAPSEPNSVGATQGNSKIDIRWAATDNALSYRVYRTLHSSSDGWTWIGSSGATSFRDGTATLKKEYDYRIRAVNPIGMSAFSSMASASRGTSKFIEYLGSILGTSSATAEEYDDLEKRVAANGTKTVGECYELGIDPEDPDDDFRITDFKMEDEKPVITVNHTEDGSGASFKSRMQMLGKKTLDDDNWDDITIRDQTEYRFFKVTVEPK